MGVLISLNEHNAVQRTQKPHIVIIKITDSRSPDNPKQSTALGYFLLKFKISFASLLTKIKSVSSQCVPETGVI